MRIDDQPVEMAMQDTGGADSPEDGELGAGNRLAALGASRSDELEAEVERLREKVAELEAELASSEFRHRLEWALTAAGAVDVPAAAALALLELDASAEGDSPPDVDALVEGLRSEKPYLFTPSAGVVATPLAGATRAAGGSSGMSEAAAEAARTGDRNALMRYLHLRRAAM